MNEDGSNALCDSQMCVCVHRALILGIVEEIKQGRGKTFAYARKSTKQRLAWHQKSVGRRK